VAHPSALPWLPADEPLASGFELVLVDLDGVVYVGPYAVVGAAESLARLGGAGKRTRFVTNNAARPPAEVAAHLRELGVEAADGDVVTAAQEGAELLARRLPGGSRVLAVGGAGVSAALEEVGLTPVSRYEDGVAGVLQGYGPDVGWRDLAEACYAVTAGAQWVATNPDLTVPTPRGTAPGNGQLTAVVARTTGRRPDVTGKPGPGLFQSAVRRGGGGRALVVGDRLDTDIAGAVAAGLPSLAVLSGVTGVQQLLGAEPQERPTYLAEDLSGLWTAHPPVFSEWGWWRCQGARARVRDGRLEAETTGAGERLDLLRAAASAHWEARDGGQDVDLVSSAGSVQDAAR
jgi:glycerol-1-phosphatase